MTASAFPEKKPGSAAPAKQLTWAEFQKKYLSREDRFKYEWVDGRVEKTPRNLKINLFYIQFNLFKALHQLKTVKGVTGQIIAEGDTFFANNHRRPDLAYYTEAQILQAAKGKNVVPGFVIEVISNKDQMNLVHKKMQDYRKAQVAVVWHIFPLLKEIHVYHGRKMEVRLGAELCAAEPVIPGFRISVDAVLDVEGASAA